MQVAKIKGMEDGWVGGFANLAIFSIERMAQLF